MRMTYEKNVSTQQTATQKNDRISSSNEHGRRTKSNPQTPQRRPQRALRVDCSFPKSARLRKRKEFLRLHKAGKRLVGRLVCLDVAKGLSPDPRLGISVSVKYGNSPERNRFKRMVREAFRIAYDQIPSFLDLHVVPRQLSKTSSSPAILQELLTLLKGLP